MFAVDIGCPRSPGKRTRNTTFGAATRVTPERIYSPSESYHAAAKGSWSASPSTVSTVRRATPAHEYNLSLSEMRHYKDEDTMVLILSHNSDPVEEAEYPVSLEQDTSEILDAEDDDTLAGYAEVASRLIKPSPLQIPPHNAEYSTGEAPRRLVYDDDVCREQFDDHTYEPNSTGLANTTSSRRENRTRSQDPADNATQRGFFSATEPPPGSAEWSPSKPVVDDQSWISDDEEPIRIDDSTSTHQTGSSNGTIRDPYSAGSSSSRPTAAETSQSRGRAFSPGGSSSGRLRSGSPKVHNGSLRRSPRAHNGSSPSSHSPSRSGFKPSGSSVARVSNGAGPRSSREQRREERRRSGRDDRSVNPSQDHPEGSSEDGTTNESSPEVSSFWAQPEARTDAAEHRVHSRIPEHTQLRDEPQGRSRDAGAPADSQLQDSVKGDGAYSPEDVRPFFSAVPPAVSAVRDTRRRRVEADTIASDPSTSFFSVNPTIPPQYKAGIPAHYPRRPVPKQKPDAPKQTSSPPIETAPPARFRNGSHAQPPSEAEEVLEGAEGLVDGTDVYNDGVDSDAPHDDPRNGNDKILESQDDHASRSFARAVTHSSLPSALPEYSTRRGTSSQRNSAMRRSSRRDAHMQSRIANLDTSNLSHYSLPTLQRLAKDMGLSNCTRLSKSELVVQLVAEIILANIGLGWSVPEVAHGHLDEEHRDSERGGAVSPGSAQSQTVYRFGDVNHRGADGRGSDVEVKEEVLPDMKERGRDMFARFKQWLPGLGRGGGPQRQGADGALPRQENGSGGSDAHEPRAPAVMGTGEVALGGVNVEEDFESLSALSMTQLQELCEDLGLEGWQRMRKYEMVGALLMDVNGLQH